MQVSEASTRETIQVRNGKIQIKTFNQSNFVLQLTLTFLLIFTLVAPFFLDYKSIDLQRAIFYTLDNLKMMFLQPALTQVTLGAALYQILITLALAFLSTIIGAVISFFLAIACAKNLAPSFLSNVIITFNSIVRAIPTVLWVLIFAIVAGLGSVAAVLGMILHTIAYLTKAYSESFEEIDGGMIEALRATGAKWWHIIIHVVLPQTSSYMISWTFLRFEINYGVAIAMGAAAAAGGIGFELFMSSSFYYDLHEVGAITYFALIIAIVLELISVRIKNSLIGK
ncbi:phosphonate ABC transporter permease [Ureibacillus massiliensis 4400831 = CIP 108448 = CCUG 49529]|uniref:Phosphonate ABC transporter permease n=1 Tax=Ureibacillus massiliensis 4400831 = CIP 108448 = CCUG 49529 TaxID=1211035 RepID=A0A0A3J1M0_9BACL|nr:ABC transporter permease subunit [Ureibacillus massiliensis]KGR89615.1 phosphonate ABC transporter permease [Ureibacillus massiliensis 4400831 = CIP 108448 = CCUG 49529]